MSPEQEQALARARARARAAAASTQGGPATAGGPPAPFERAGGYGAADAGMADATIKAWIGLKDMLGMRNEDDTAVLAELKKEQDADPEKFKRTYGNILGNIGLTAGASGAMAKGYTAAKSALPNVLKFLAAPAAGAAVSGAQDFALTPGTYGEKAEAGKTGAMWGGALSGAAAAASKGLTQMFKPTAEAQDLMRQGVNPTLQQGAESAVGRFIGGLTSGAVDVRTRQNQEIIDALLKRVAPGMDTAGMTIPERVALLSERFNGTPGGAKGEYDALMAGKKFILTQPARGDVWAAARGPKGTQPEATQLATEAMSGTGTAMQSQNTVRMSYDKLKEYRMLMQDAVNSFNSNNGVMEQQAKKNLIKAREVFDNLVRDPSLSAAEKAALADIDARYGDFLRFADAAGSSGFHAKPTAARVMKSYENMAPSSMSFARAENDTQRELLEPAVRTMGLTPTQDEARSLVASIKRAGKVLATGAVGAGAVAGNPYGLALAPAYGISLAGQTKQGARALFGENAWQKALAAKLRDVGPYTLGAGQAITGEE